MCYLQIIIIIIIIIVIIIIIIIISWLWKSWENVLVLWFVHD